MFYDQVASEIGLMVRHPTFPFCLCPPPQHSLTLTHFSTNIVFHFIESIECSQNIEEGKFMMATLGSEHVTLAPLLARCSNQLS